MLVVSHDLGVIRMLADRTLVMLDGQVIESGLTDQILEDPQHAYTQQLVYSLALTAAYADAAGSSGTRPWRSKPSSPKYASWSFTPISGTGRTLADLLRQPMTLERTFP